MYGVSEETSGSSASIIHSRFLAKLQGCIAFLSLTCRVRINLSLQWRNVSPDFCRTVGILVELLVKLKAFEILVKWNLEKCANSINLSRFSRHGPAHLTQHTWTNAPDPTHLTQHTQSNTLNPTHSMHLTQHTQSTTLNPTHPIQRLIQLISYSWV